MDELVEKWAAIPQRQRFMLVGLVVSLLAVGYWFLFYGDLTAQRDHLARQLQERQTARVAKEGVRDNLARYQERLAELAARLEEARAQLPDTAEVPQLLSELSGRAQQLALQIEEFQPKDETNRGFYSEIGFDMRVTGSFHDIAMFVDSVGRLDRIVNVADLKLDTPRQANSKTVVNGKFRVKAFRFAQEQVVKQ